MYYYPYFDNSQIHNHQSRSLLTFTIQLLHELPWLSTLSLPTHFTRMVSGLVLGGIHVFSEARLSFLKQILIIILSQRLQWLPFAHRILFKLLSYLVLRLFMTFFRLYLQSHVKPHSILKSQVIVIENQLLCPEHLVLFLLLWVLGSFFCLKLPHSLSPLSSLDHLLYSSETPLLCPMAYSSKELSASPVDCWSSCARYNSLP